MSNWNLLTPPVVQVWVGFGFQPSPTKVKWNHKEAVKFLKRFSELFPFRDQRIKYEMEDPGRASRDRSKSITVRGEVDTIRVRDEEGSRWLQVSDDKLVYNEIFNNKKYSGFRVIREEALARFCDYVSYFRPENLQEVEIHYVDMIDIKLKNQDSQDSMSLGDYFTIDIDVPSQPFGSVNDFTIKLTFTSNIPQDHLQLTLRRQPPPEDTQAFRVRMDWHIIGTAVDSLAPDVVGARLHQAHEYLRDCFRAAFTPKGWALFGPEQTDFFQ